jgi:MFS family permease
LTNPLCFMLQTESDGESITTQEKQEIFINDENEEIFSGLKDIEQKNEKDIETPLPYRKLLVAILLISCDYLSGAALFPYLSQMTCDILGLDEKKDAKLVGYYAGFIGSSYYITQLFSAPLWGYISDRVGRRPVMLTGIVGTIISCLLFGFSKWYWLTIFSRCLYGAFNGNTGVVKTYIRENTDVTNQARAFSILGSTYAVGVVFGPLIGGFLSRPQEKIPFLFDNWFFNMFPYCLPNLFISGISMVAGILGYFFLIETKFASKVATSTEENSTTKKWSIRRILNAIRNSPLLRTREPLIAAISYAMLGLTDIIFLEVFPIWVWTPIPNKGLGIEPYQIGILNMVLGIMIFLTQLWGAPILVKKLNVKGTFIITAILCTPPCFILVDIYGMAYSHRWLMWTLLSLVYLWRVVFIEMCFTAVMMMINNSVESSSLGSVNGLAQSLVALTRTIGPALGSSLFAFSLSVDYFLIFDVHFVFFMTGFLTILLVPIGLMAPDSINSPK